ncbi:MAG: CHASE domain-containing protein, partial [Chloroflexi bacterium]|nr:CHASE domain-containing protein [Chloroflexota bacterium]
MRRYTLMAGLAALGISLSILAFVVVLGFERDRNRQDFDFKASNMTSALQTELGAHVDAVLSIRSLYSASESISRSEFEIFVRNELTSHPAIQALEWIPRITADDRKDFETSMQSEGFKDFKILERLNRDTLSPAGDRFEYFPVTYIEPYSENEASLGFDLASDPSRYEALKDARDTGEFVATQRV